MFGWWPITTGRSQVIVNFFKLIFSEDGVTWHEVSDPFKGSSCDPQNKVQIADLQTLGSKLQAKCSVYPFSLIKPAISIESSDALSWNASNESAPYVRC